MFRKTYHYLNNSNVSGVLLAILLVIGFILRFYKLEMADGWLYSIDVPKDILVGEHIAKYKEFTLTAPCAVGGQGFLKNSPLHYYMIAGFWWLTGSVVGVLFCGVILGVATIFLSFLVGKELSSKVLGLLFALFFTFNEMLIKFSLLTIQPYYLPFFTLLIMVLLLKFRHNRNIFFLIGAEAAMWFGLNIHYSFLQLFLIFNLIIVWMLFFDNKIKKIRWLGLTVFGCSTLLWGVVWLVTSQNYEFVKNVGGFFGLMDNGSLKNGFMQESIGNINSFLRLVFFGYYDLVKSNWVVFIFTAILLFFTIVLWLKNKKERWILICLSLMMSGFLAIALIEDGINRMYFATFVPIAIMGTVYVFYRVAKIRLWVILGLAVLLFFSFEASFLRLSTKRYMNISNLDYAELMAQTIYDDYKRKNGNEGMDFSIYYADDVDTFNLGLAFYHFLEEKTGKILDVYGYDFKQTDNRVNYVVCRSAAYNQRIKESCLEKFDGYSGQEAKPIKSMLVDDGYYVIYRLSGL